MTAAAATTATAATASTFTLALSENAGREDQYEKA